jgi:acyl-CoA synthetase (NDP forming)
VVDSLADARAARVLQRARAEGRDALIEGEGFALVEALGIRAPTQRLVAGPQEAARLDLAEFKSDRVVVKAASPVLPHKTDVGAVQVVPATAAAVQEAVSRMAVRLSAYPIRGYVIAEYVPHSEALGGELLLGLRNTDDFGPVVVVGPGGVHAELLAQSLSPGADLAVLTGGLFDTQHLAQLLADRPATRVAGGLGRDRCTLLPLERLATLAERLLAFAGTSAGAQLAELEINPLALTPDGPVALDVLVTLRRTFATPWRPRPLHKLGHLLRPQSIAVVGVSQGMNPGRLIVRNLLQAGFPAERIAIIKAGVEQLDGIRCYPDVPSLPGPVDLCVLAVSAAQVPDLTQQLVEGHKAESLILIPSGLGESEGSDALECRVRDILAASRRTAWGGPVVNGGNCLGVRSAAGHYDATFVPEYKVRQGRPAPAPVALISQSGAFAIARWSKLAGLNPAYLVSVGNQTDLTLGDYLTYLKDDPEIRVFACYAEGFRALDGRRWLAAAREIVDSGRTVLLYRGARTPAGVRAGASHTAAIAGDYLVTRELARAAGVLVADTLDEFDDLLRLFCLLGDHRAAGMRLGVVSNAGFECVVAADTLGTFQLARLGMGTITKLRQVLARAGLADFVPVHHPLDLGPITNDATFAACARVLLEDEQVDAGVVGVVPLTTALQTLPPGSGHREDCASPDAIALALGRLAEECHKPWVAVVDAGCAYDPLAARLEALRIPTFRSVDRALRAFAAWCRASSQPEHPLDPYQPGVATAKGTPW